MHIQACSFQTFVPDQVLKDKTLKKIGTKWSLKKIIKRIFDAENLGLVESDLLNFAAENPRI